jgi:hypothetical protein
MSIRAGAPDSPTYGALAAKCAIIGDVFFVCAFGVDPNARHASAAQAAAKMVRRRTSFIGLTSRL